VAVGEANNLKFAVARYNADGTPDVTFGGDGKATTNFTPTVDSLGTSLFRETGRSSSSAAQGADSQWPAT
jgi:hypothetical protein